MTILSAFVSGISTLADGVGEVAKAASERVAKEANVNWGMAPEQEAPQEELTLEGLWASLGNGSIVDGALQNLAWDGQERSNGNMDHIDGATQHGQRPDQGLVLSA